MNLLPGEPSQQLMWGLLIILVAGYAFGTWLNRSRSKALGNWLQATVPSLGKGPAWKWIGTMTSGAQLTIEEPARPYRQFQITYLLLTRELFFLWGIELLRGKRDLLSVRANLRDEPNGEIEVVPIQGKLRRAVDANAGDQPWSWQEAPAGLGLATRGTIPSKAISTLRSFLERYGASVERISFRHRKPHLILFIRLEGLEKAPCNDFLRALREVSEAQVSHKTEA